MYEYRWSASFLKKYKLCPFSMYCKITKQDMDPVDAKYGDAGNVVHHVLQYYYENLYEIKVADALIELQNVFNGLWEEQDLQNTDLIKEQYWISILNGVKKDIKLTHCELEIEFKKPFPFVSYIDVANTETHMIGDWKTSTYKSSKLAEYKNQLLFYSYAYYRKFGIIPNAWVLFNKTNKLFPFKFAEKELKDFENEMLAYDIEIKERLKRQDFPRTPSRDACYWCPYKTICSTDLARKPVDNKEEFKITYGIKDDKLFIQGSIPEICHKKFEDHINYELKNAHFIKAAMAKKGIKYDAIKRLYKRKPNGGQTYPGYLQFANKLFQEYCDKKNLKYVFQIIDKRDANVMYLDYFITDKLNIPFDFYDFQLQAVDLAIDNRWGIVQVGTGGGKTVIASELIRRLCKQTLFVIDNKDLLIQTKTEYETMLEQECGIVGMGKEDWNKTIVLATIQTLNKRLKEKDKNTIEQLKKFVLVIFDEVQIIAAPSFEKLSKYLINTKYRIGFSATPKRDDGNDKLIYAHTGEVIFKKPAIDLINDGVLVKPKAIFYEYETSPIFGVDFPSEYEEGIVNNEVRNNLILDLVKQNSDKQIIILCKRVKHCKFFHEKLQGSRLIFGKTKDDIREQDLIDFKENKYNILVGNLVIFNKGLNIKSLSVVINVSGNAGEVVTIQTIGRGLRNDIGKTKTLYIDFIDHGQYLLDHSYKRKQALLDEGYEVVVEKFINKNENLI
jgi:superfamily II DNA or RNA helicase/CRISPR/Cas system-associated exonuclease Cas4 (RecB family)